MGFGMEWIVFAHLASVCIELGYDSNDERLYWYSIVGGLVWKLGCVVGLFEQAALFCGQLIWDR